MDARFVAIDARFNEMDMRFVPVKIAGWVAGAMIGSSGVIFGGFQLLRGLL